MTPSLEELARILVTTVICGLAAYRITRFFVMDSLIGANPNAGSRVSKWLNGVDKFGVPAKHDSAGAPLPGWAYNLDESNRGAIRGYIGDLWTCPYCLGFWVTLAVLGIWVAGGWMLIVPWAVAGVQAQLHTKE